MNSEVESKIRSSMGKLAYYDKFEINTILSDAKKSINILESREASSWKNQKDTQLFCEQILEEIDLISFWNKNDLSNLYEWYKPQGKWDNKNSYAYRNLGIYHYDKGEFEKASEHFEMAYEFDKNTHLITEYINKTKEKLQKSTHNTNYK